MLEVQRVDIVYKGTTAAMASIRAFLVDNGQQHFANFKLRIIATSVDFRSKKVLDTLIDRDGNKHSVDANR